jgi:uncharacterized membrane protein
MPNASLSLDGSMIAGRNLNFRVYGDSEFASSMYLILAILLILLLIVIFFLMLSKKVRISVLFLVIMLSFGTLYMFVFPPNTAPDEGTHFLTTYQLADRVLGQKSEQEYSFMMREEDRAHESIFFHYPDHETYTNYAQDLKRFRTDMAGEALHDNLIFMEPTIPYEFYPQTIGFVIARVLHLTVGWQYLLGRFFNLLIFSLLIFLAIERTPIGKGVFACISLFPMTLEIVSSLSYDTSVIALAFLGTAEYLYIAYGDKHARVRDLVALNVILLLLGPTKAIYVTMFLLAFFIPKKYFESRKQLIVYRSVVALVFLAVCAVTVKLNVEIVTSHSADRGVSREEEILTMADLLADPLKFVEMAVYTTAVRMNDFIYTLIGKKLGNLDIPIRNFVIWGFFLAALVSAVSMKDSRETIGKRERIQFPIVFIGSYIGMLLVFFIAWTKVNSTIIEGLQGRYLTPVLPLLLLLLNGKKLTRKRITDKHLLVFVSFLQCVVLITVFQVIVCR